MFQPTTITVTYEDGTTSTFVHTFESGADHVRQSIQSIIDDDIELRREMDAPLPGEVEYYLDRYPLDLEPRYDDRLTSKDY